MSSHKFTVKATKSVMSAKAKQNETKKARKECNYVEKFYSKIEDPLFIPAIGLKVTSDTTVKHLNQVKAFNKLFKSYYDNVHTVVDSYIDVKMKMVGDLCKTVKPSNIIGSGIDKIYLNKLKQNKTKSECSICLEDTDTFYRCPECNHTDEDKNLCVGCFNSIATCGDGDVKKVNKTFECPHSRHQIKNYYNVNTKYYNACFTIHDYVDDEIHRYSKYCDRVVYIWHELANKWQTPLYKFDPETYFDGLDDETSDYYDYKLTNVIKIDGEQVGKPVYIPPEESESDSDTDQEENNDDLEHIDWLVDSYYTSETLDNANIPISHAFDIIHLAEMADGLDTDIDVATHTIYTGGIFDHEIINQVSEEGIKKYLVECLSICDFITGRIDIDSLTIPDNFKDIAQHQDDIQTLEQSIKDALGNNYELTSIYEMNHELNPTRTSPILILYAHIYKTLYIDN